MRFLVVTLALSSACTSCVPAPAPLLPPELPPEVAECAPPSSRALVIDGVEGTPGYDDELEALALDELPPSISLAPLSQLQRDLVLYMLDPVTPFDELDRDTALTTPLGRAVLGAYAKAALDGGEAGALDFTFLRRGLHRFYACERGFPLTLAEFNATVVDVDAMEINETVDSRVKNLPRRMRRSVVDGAFVAETLLPGDVVRETEILLTDRRNDGAIEFIEYDDHGDLRGASMFATSTGAESVGAVPFTCIACHNTHDVSPAPPP